MSSPSSQCKTEACAAWLSNPPSFATSNCSSCLSSSTCSTIWTGPSDISDPFGYRGYCSYKYFSSDPRDITKQSATGYYTRDYTTCPNNAIAFTNTYQQKTTICSSVSGILGSFDTIPYSIRAGVQLSTGNLFIATEEHIPSDGTTKRYNSLCNISSSSNSAVSCMEIKYTIRATAVDPLTGLIYFSGSFISVYNGSSIIQLPETGIPVTVYNNYLYIWENDVYTFRRVSVINRTDIVMMRSLSNMRVLRGLQYFDTARDTLFFIAAYDGSGPSDGSPTVHAWYNRMNSVNALQNLMIPDSLSGITSFVYDSTTLIAYVMFRGNRFVAGGLIAVNSTGSHSIILSPQQCGIKMQEYSEFEPYDSLSPLLLHQGVLYVLCDEGVVVGVNVQSLVVTVLATAAHCPYGIYKDAERGILYANCGRSRVLTVLPPIPACNPTNTPAPTSTSPPTGNTLLPTTVAPTTTLLPTTNTPTTSKTATGNTPENICAKLIMTRCVYFFCT